MESEDVDHVPSSQFTVDHEALKCLHAKRGHIPANPLSSNNKDWDLHVNLSLPTQAGPLPFCGNHPAAVHDNAVTRHWERRHGGQQCLLNVVTAPQEGCGDAVAMIKLGNTAAALPEIGPDAGLAINTADCSGDPEMDIGTLPAAGYEKSQDLHLMRFMHTQNLPAEQQPPLHDGASPARSMSYLQLAQEPPANCSGLTDSMQQQQQQQHSSHKQPCLQLRQPRLGKERPTAALSISGSLQQDALLPTPALTSIQQNVQDVDNHCCQQHAAHCTLYKQTLDGSIREIAQAAWIDSMNPVKSVFVVAFTFDKPEHLEPSQVGMNSCLDPSCVQQKQSQSSVDTFVQAHLKLKIVGKAADFAITDYHELAQMHYKSFCCWLAKIDGVLFYLGYASSVCPSEHQH